MDLFRLVYLPMEARKQWLLGNLGVRRVRDLEGVADLVSVGL
jgi:hypothetical protein